MWWEETWEHLVKLVTKRISSWKNMFVILGGQNNPSKFTFELYSHVFLSFMKMFVSV